MPSGGKTANSLLRRISWDRHFSCQRIGLNNMFRCYLRLQPFECTLPFFSRLGLRLPPLSQIWYWGKFRCEIRDDPAVEADTSTKFFHFLNTLRSMDFSDFFDKAIIGLNSAPWKRETEKVIFSKQFQTLFHYSESLVFHWILNCPPTLLTLIFFLTSSLKQIVPNNPLRIISIVRWNFPDAFFGP